MTTSSGAGWNLTTLGAACEVNPGRPNLTGISDDTTVLFVPMAAVDDVTGTVSLPQERSLGEVKSKSYRSFAPGDVLFAKITPCMENGKSAVVPNTPSGIGFGSTEFHVLRPKLGLNPRFLWHFLRQETFRRTAREHMTGSVGQARVPAEFIKRFSVAIPDPATQEEIVRLLDEALDSGLGARGHLAAGRRAVERFRGAVLTAACSGRLSASWNGAETELGASLAQLRDHARQHPEVVVNSRRTKPARGVAVPEQSDHFPGSWAYCRVRELVELRAIVDVQDGNHGELYPRQTDFAERGVPFISAENVDGRVRVDRAPRLKEEVANRLRIGFALPGDVILTHNATVGRVATMPRDGPEAVLSTSTTYYRTDERVLLSEYLALFMKSAFFQDQLRAIMEQTTRNQVPVTKQVELCIGVPPIEEQHEIVRRVAQLLSQEDSALSRLDRAARQVERLTQAILAKVFHGEQLPTDAAHR